MGKVFSFGGLWRWRRWRYFLIERCFPENFLTLVTDERISIDGKRSFSHNQVRLNHRDMSLYGVCPENEVFTLVTCYCCGMVVKQQAFNQHLQKRHNFGSDNFEATANDHVKEVKVNAPKAKKQRIDINLNIEHFPLGYSTSMVNLPTQKLFISNSTSSLHNHQGMQREGQRIKVKLKKSGLGGWRVINGWLGDFKMNFAFCNKSCGMRFAMFWFYTPNYN